MQVLLHFLIWLGNLPQGKGISFTTSPPMFIFLSYPCFADIIFLYSNAPPFHPLLLEFGTAHMVEDVASLASTFLFPLTSPLEILIGKELRPMVIPTKSWPRASKDWIT